MIRRYLPQCWYTEKWYDGDLMEALHDSGVPVTEENVERLRETCKNAFDDKSERNNMLRQIARETFGDILKEN